MKQITLEFKEMPFAVEEALNRLRINMKFCGKNTKKILITSTLPDEGKSTISLRLWKMLAETGFPTAFVDMDLRKSVLKTRNHIQLDSNTKGQEEKDLGYYLSGQADYEDVVYKTNIENGYMVPCFTQLENPSMLLEDDRFQELLDKLAEDYRYVIIDSPPLGSVADGIIAASYADGSILVVRSGYASRKLIRQSIQQLGQADCKLLGIVLNRAETGGRAYKKYYGKYYGDYYGEDSAR